MGIYGTAHMFSLLASTWLSFVPLVISWWHCLCMWLWVDKRIRVRSHSKSSSCDENFSSYERGSVSSLRNPTLCVVQHFLARFYFLCKLFSIYSIISYISLGVLKSILNQYNILTSLLSVCKSHVWSDLTSFDSYFIVGTRK